MNYIINSAETHSLTPLATSYCLRFRSVLPSCIYGHHACSPHMENSLTHLIILYRYELLIPAAFFEGHVISLIAGLLSSLGYLNFFLSWLCIVIGNLLGDIWLYWLGYHTGNAFARHLTRFLGIKTESIEKVKGIFSKHEGGVLFASKLTNGFGLAMVVLYTAGTIKVDFKKYMLWNLLGEAVWTLFLLSIGYFFAFSIVYVENITSRIGLLVAGALTVLIVIMFVRSYYKRLFKL